MTLQRPTLYVGLIDDSFQLSKFPGASKRSYGLKADGKIFHNSAQGKDFCSKLSSGDIVGCGILFDTQEIFFTKNGVYLGIAFKCIDTIDYFPAVALLAPQESITFNFTGPFAYDVDSLSMKEAARIDNEVLSVNVSTAELHDLVYDYLKYNGYYQTLLNFPNLNAETPKFDSTLLKKSRSYSGRISEKVGSIDINPDCLKCEKALKICEECLRVIMQNVEPVSPLKVPLSSPYGSRQSSFCEPYNLDRCDSVDLSSLYLKNQDLILDEIPELNEIPDDSLEETKSRSSIRNLIMQGKIQEAKQVILLKYPGLENNEELLLALHTQEFIEIVNRGEVYSALEYAKQYLASYREKTVSCRSGNDMSIYVWEVIGLLCYTKPNESVLSHLLTLEKREATADVINRIIIAMNDNSNCKLEFVMKQMLAVQSLYMENQLRTSDSHYNLLI